VLIQVFCLTIGLFSYQRIFVEPQALAMTQCKNLKGQLIICSIKKQNRDRLTFETNIEGTAYMAYLKKKNVNYYPGDTLLIEKFNISLITLDNQKDNNYTKYLLSKGIKGQIFLTQNKVLAVNDGHGLLRFAYKIRQNIIQKVQDEMVLSPSEEGIFYSLLLGERSYLDKEIKEDFKESGIIHVLAISGLHVGILYVFMQSILKLFRVHNKYFKLVFVVLILLFYALIAGLSPSVVRAVLMCCLLQFGSFLQEKNVIMNIILSSALFLLVFKPEWIWDLGFLLSYSAVIFIVLTLNYFDDQLREITNPFLKKISQLMLVNMAAFSGTFPLLIYNFGIVYFGSILTSLVIVPLVAILVMFGITTLLFVPFKSLFHFTLMADKQLIQLLNYAANEFSESISFPFSFELNILPCLLLYIVLFTILSQHITFINKLKTLSVVLICVLLSSF
jgi:competence protein ComEC